MHRYTRQQWLVVFVGVAFSLTLSIFVSSASFGLNLVPIPDRLPDSMFKALPDLVGTTETADPTSHIISDTLGQMDPPESRPPVVIPAETAKILQTPKPRVETATGGHKLNGLASWYCNADASRAVLSKCVKGYPDTSDFDAYGAAGPKLRIAMGGGASTSAPDPWRGKIVLVNGVRVKLIDWCQCYYRQDHEKIIDLYYDVFIETKGKVTITW